MRVNPFIFDSHPIGSMYGIIYIYIYKYANIGGIFEGKCYHI